MTDSSDFPDAPAPTAPRGTLEALIPVPAIVQQRAWECAFMVGAEHSAELRRRLGASAGTEVWHWAQACVLRGAEAMTWADCRMAFRSHRLVFGVRK
jgi:hypothetical protein